MHYSIGDDPRVTVPVPYATCGRCYRRFQSVTNRLCSPCEAEVIAHRDEYGPEPDPDGRGENSYGLEAMQENEPLLDAYEE